MEDHEDELADFKTTLHPDCMFGGELRFLALYIRSSRRKYAYVLAAVVLVRIVVGFVSAFVSILVVGVEVVFLGVVVMLVLVLVVALVLFRVVAVVVAGGGGGEGVAVAAVPVVL